MLDESELKSRHEATLRAFVPRARRVESHSLVVDNEALDAFANGRLTLELTRQGASIVQKLPPEEQLESLAARVRPLLLQKEPTHNSRVTNALSYFARSDDSLREPIHGLKSRWAALRPDSKSLLGYSAQVMASADAEVESMTDLQLAYAWLYGDVVHGDQDRLKQARAFGLDERFRAAILLIANAARYTVWTLNTLRNVRYRGLVNLDDALFLQPVVVTDTEYRREASAMIGQPGAQPPNLGDEWPDGWTQVNGPGLLDSLDQA